MTSAAPEDGPDLDALKEVDRAAVFKNGALAAHLTRLEAGRVGFAYTADWVANAGPPVATTLPVVTEPVVSLGGAVPAFFAGLLPEGRRLTALRRGVKTSADDELSLVLGVGGDTVGDVQVVPDGLEPAPVLARVQVASWEEASFSEVLRSLDVRVDRVGLPGVQDKVSAAMLSIPVSAHSSQVLLKLNPAEFKHLVENEHFFLQAAASSGIRTVEARLVRDRDGAPGLAVTRFDRVASAGTTRSLPAEDGCQVLGLHPAEKYRVSCERLFARLSSICEAPIPAASEFLAQIAFAYVTGNGDAHAKNFSVLRDVDGRWQPSPAYDVPSSFFYGDSTMALSIDGRRDANLTRARFLALAAAIGVTQRAAARALDRVSESADAWLDQVGSLPFDAGLVAKYRRVVANRRRLLQQA